MPFFGLSQRVSGYVARYYLLNSAFNGSRALYISTYSLFLIDVLSLPLVVITWLFALNIAAALLMELPAGALADLRGHRAVFVSACVVSTIGSLVYWICGVLREDMELYIVIAVACFAEVLLALGFALYSGVLDAWVVNHRSRDGRRTLQEILSKGAFYKNIAFVICGVSGTFVFFLGVSWINTFLISAALAATISSIASFTMEGGRAPGEASNRAHGYGIVNHITNSFVILRRNPKLLILVFNGSFAFLSLQIIVFYWPIVMAYRIDTDISIIRLIFVLSFSWVLAYGSRAIGNFVAGTNWGSTNALGIVIGGTLLIGLPLVGMNFLMGRNSWNPGLLYGTFTFLYAMNRMGEGMLSPTRLALINTLLENEYRTTLLSADSAISLVVSACGVFIAGIFLYFGLDLGGILLLAGLVVLGTIPLYYVGLSSKCLGG